MPLNNLPLSGVASDKSYIVLMYLKMDRNVMTSNIPLLPNKLYKITNTEGESLSDCFYIGETDISYIFHSAAILGAEIKIPKTAMPGVVITN
ncbi:hypothetical protein [Nostoc sp. DedSLP04]|uniref:hypothetical protein n=1 Tax=Nostoc sp. DedSLP04 TaxID=3075401 RepID=UPI002AD47221|nr:hypothetical protein [Nostoc sp. DedSLP04]MDZ8036070.1 hypothetical protein [Nostoc sp. DedSLP04]